ncbi:UDP-glucuronosyl/UDP-glucosyltransferase [Artemisia annua]|uniref:UDP-glucuronosyl/UDP-glucosyltransferase n=1 Tax=Artemisia annua TaxID=35608 RepID=A0A2U1KCC7_ARTAN|nr:UDP-glucuronosyl/UDP-glucosyltransferase [Artemisia annua]
MVICMKLLQVKFLYADVREHLSRKKVPYIPVSSPHVLSPVEDNNTSGSVPFTFCEEKRRITREHRQECVVIFEDIFGDVPVMEADLVIINFFALEGWNLAELFNVRCVIAAPYVVPYSAPSSFERKFSEELPLLYNFLQEVSSDKNFVRSFKLITFLLVVSHKLCSSTFAIPKHDNIEVIYTEVTQLYVCVHLG